MLSFRSCRVLLLAAFLCTLAGCFTSTRPLFPETTAETPLENGAYTTYACENGTCEAEDKITLTVQGKHYTMMDKDGQTSTLTLHPHGEGQFIVQMESQAQGKTAYNYLLLRMQGGEMFLSAPACNGQNAAQLTALGVVVDVAAGGFIGSYAECKLDGVTDTKALFAAVNWGESMLKLVREPDTATH